MRAKTREEILKENPIKTEEQVKIMVKELLERLTREERALYLLPRPPGAKPATSSPLQVL
ncbi:MAG: hypothetical protein QW175_02340 [Candidatus Bathyarchaeia archaeon]